jgi:glyoxylase-like metal-dependent hydrolase (beta-lactamase superfamily II)
VPDLTSVPPPDRPLTRRNALRTLAAAALAVPAVTPRAFADAAPPPPAADAKPPVHGAGFYRLRIGEIEAMILSDGTLNIQPAYPTLAPQAPEADVAAALSGSFLPTDRVTAHINSLLVKFKSDTVLIDSGGGGLVGPDCGRLAANLLAAGVAPAQVTAVVLTHAHPDHFGGLLDAAGQRVFPNASYFVGAKEVEFWTSPTPDLSRSPLDEAFKATLVAAARRVLDSLKDHLHLVKPGDTILGGLDLVDGAGHTPGHLVARISSGGGQFMNIADLAHHHVLMFEHPEWSPAFDVDPQQAVQTRRRLFDQIAADRVRVLGYHLPFPGLGHIRRQGGGYEWVPEPWSWS